MALESAFEPSMMNRRGTAGSSPRSIKLSISAWTTAECSVAPSMSPSGCFVPSLSIPIAATSTISSAIWMPSICTTMMSRWPRSDPIHSFMRAVESATKRREVADFDTPAPRGAGTSPSGSRTARRNFRVDTLINIRFIAHRPSQSSSLARSQLGSGNSWPSKSRTRGRSSSTLPPWKPILPRVRPQRYPRRPSPRAWRGPQTSSASFSSMALTVSRPAARQKRSKLADTSSKALPTGPLGTALVVVLNLFMALLSFRGISTRAYRLKASNAAPSISTFAGTSPTGLQQLHSCGVSQDVWCYTLARQGWTGLAGDGHMLGQDILHPISTEFPAASVGEQHLAIAPDRLLQPWLQNGNCLLCQRRATLLATLADDLNVRTGTQAYVLSLEVRNLRQPCTGLHCEQQQSVIATSRPRTPSGRRQQCIHFRAYQKANLPTDISF